MNRQEADMWAGRAAEPRGEFYSQPSDGPRDAQGHRTHRDGSRVYPESTPQPAVANTGHSMDPESTQVLLDLTDALSTLVDHLVVMRQTQETIKRMLEARGF